MRARIRLPVKGLFVPLLLRHRWRRFKPDVEYQTGWVGVSLLYRYLSFQQSAGSVIKLLAMGGWMVLVDFRF
jgi:hypothetical protein